MGIGSWKLLPVSPLSPAFLLTRYRATSRFDASRAGDDDFMKWADEGENIKNMYRIDSPEESNHEIQPTNP